LNYGDCIIKEQIYFNRKNWKNKLKKIKKSA